MTMAMTFEFNIRPFGYQNDAITFGRMRVHSAGSRHEYAGDYKAEDGWTLLTSSPLNANSAELGKEASILCILSRVNTG